MPARDSHGRFVAGSGKVEAEFDSSGLQAGLASYRERVIAAAKQATEIALQDLERHCKDACPVDQGVLMRSIHAGDVTVTEDEISGTISTGAESSDYAIVQHEDVLQHQHPRAGQYAAKYIENPLKEMAPRYNAYIGEAVAKVTNG